MREFTRCTSRMVPLLVDNVDTDQIIPARFLKVTDKTGLGDHLFADWRYAADGKPVPGFILNDPSTRGAEILLAGDNFGCGSSREHAPWALAAFGFRAVISTSFADIFSNNALKNGLLPLRLSAEDYGRVRALAGKDPGASVTIDVQSQTLELPGGSRCPFPLDGFAKTCLLRGVDELGYIMRFTGAIDAWERAAGKG
ncbi:MAG TPA: 3-isopropylmalate dehydratase small subunit [Bacteroidota bacterium]|nr:3-isopropylmalate dehydratase small subunit [Bacteroidota bacterium]